MKCPDCENGTTLILFPVYAESVPLEKRKPVIATKCFRCRGSCEVPDETHAWILNGRKMKKERIARGVGLRQEAILRGIKPSELNDMERGVIEPKEAP